MAATTTHCQPTPTLARTYDNTLTPISSVSLELGILDWWCSESDTDPAEALDLARLYPGGQDLALIRSASPPTWTFGGRFAGCENFSAATSQYLSRGDEPMLRYAGGSATFSAWVYLTSKASYRSILSKKSASVTEYELAYSGGEDRFLFLFSTPTKTFSAFGASGAIALNTWYLLIGWYDESRDQIGFSINSGAPVYGNGTPAASIYGAELRIGSNAFIGSQLWNGRIEQVLRWNRLLTDSERAVLVTTSYYDLHGATPFYPAGDGLLTGYPISSALPDAPSDLSLVIDAGNAVDLSWTDNAVNSMGVQIERATDGGAFSFLASVGAAYGMTYHDAVDATAHAYDYRIRAVNFNGASAYSNTAPSAAFLFSIPENSQFLSVL